MFVRETFIVMWPIFFASKKQKSKLVTIKYTLEKIYKKSKAKGFEV